ncbi:MAG: HEPN domain-containing protein [Candidatus Kapabacteria bacterium]|nr:HEPN domain-containing protein [Candidatus Kapabacteria bacterium]
MMTIEEHIEYWIESAERNLSSATSNYKSVNYDWCLFIGHLVLEKIKEYHKWLKSLIE